MTLHSSGSIGEGGRMWVLGDLPLFNELPSAKVFSETYIQHGESLPKWTGAKGCFTFRFTFRLTNRPAQHLVVGPLYSEALELLFLVLLREGVVGAARYYYRAGTPSYTS